VDLLRCFCGEVAEVSCFKDIRMPEPRRSRRGHRLLNLRFENGALGRVGLFLGPILPFTFTLRLFGTKGSLDNNGSGWTAYPSSRKPGMNKIHPTSKVVDPDNVQGGFRDLEGVSGRIHRRHSPGRNPDNDAVSGFIPRGLLRRPAIRGGRQERASERL